MNQQFLNVKVASIIFLALNALNLISSVFCFFTYAIFQKLFDEVFKSDFFDDFTDALQSFVLLFVFLLVLKSAFSIWFAKKSLDGFRWSQTAILILSGLSSIVFLILIGQIFNQSEFEDGMFYNVVSALIPLALNTYIFVTMVYSKRGEIQGGE